MLRALNGFLDERIQNFRNSSRKPQHQARLSSALFPLLPLLAFWCYDGAFCGKATRGRNGLFQLRLESHSPSLEQIRVRTPAGTRGRNYADNLLIGIFSACFLIASQDHLYMSSTSAAHDGRHHPTSINNQGHSPRDMLTSPSDLGSSSVYFPLPIHLYFGLSWQQKLTSTNTIVRVLQSLKGLSEC